MTGNTDLLSDLPGETVQQVQAQARKLSQAATIFAIKRFSTAIGELKGSFQPQLPLELALIEAIQGENAPAPTAPQPPSAAPATPSVITTPVTPVNTQKPAADTTIAKSSAEVASAAEPAPLDPAAVKKVQARWAEFKQIVRQQCGQQVWAAVNTVRDIAVNAQAVAFAFGNNQFTHDIVAKPETRQRVAAILSNMLGRPLQLECQMGDHARLTNMVMAPGEPGSANGADPLVEFALTELHAELKDSSKHKEE
jgi:hypothetical protein